MDALIDKTIRAGLGYATHSDAFQCGREAAQEAKGQLSEGSPSLVLIVGSETVHFTDFIEGARLVLGEDALVAIPSKLLLSNETTSPHAGYVAALQLPGMKVSIASDEMSRQNI